MSRLKLAVIGAGHLGKIHAKLASSNEQFELVAVADPNPNSQARVAEELHVPVTDDFRNLIGKIDAAIVATPTMHHYEVGSALLREGIHCLIEKPLATSSDQASRLVQIARRYSRVLQVGHVERFNPKWTTAVPHLGTPKFIDSIRCGSYSGRSTDIGAVMDIMIHDLDLILSLDRSEIVNIDASGIALLGSHEDMAEARLTFESGLIANLRASRLAQSTSRRMQLYTTSCYAEIDFSADEFRVVQPSQEVIARLVGLDELEPAQRMSIKDQIFETYFSTQTISAPGRNAILDEHNDFALSIQTGCSPAVSGEDGWRAVDVADRILSAIGQRGWDGQSSRRWRIGAHAMLGPRTIPMSDFVAEVKEPKRRAG